MLELQQRKVEQSVWRRVTSLGAFCFVIVLLSVSSPMATAAEEEIDDSRIEMAIEGELWGAKGVNANNIDLSVLEGVVTLSGNVDNLLSKETAVRVAQMTKGVRSVVDQLNVKTADRPDEELKTDVVTALAEDPATDSWEIDVEARPQSSEA